MTDAEHHERLELLRAVEAAAVRGWPASETLLVDGWLARCTSGGSVRANSVAALSWTGTDLEQSISAVDRFYGARNARAMFTISEVSMPPGLDDLLEARGYARSGDHVTMAKAVDPCVSVPDGLSLTGAVDGDWLHVYLSGLSADRRDVAPSILERLPRACYVSEWRAGHVVASGLTIVDGKVASVQCMATLPQARRSGAATAVLAAIEHHAAAAGARHLYLQTDAGNSAAQALYRRAGYDILGHYHTRIRAP